MIPAAGQRKETFGLLDYNARYYNPRIGKFISADTLVPDPSNPQAFNRYGYAYNNPIRFNDPTGHDCGLPASSAGTSFLHLNGGGPGPNVGEAVIAKLVVDLTTVVAGITLLTEEERQQLDPNRQSSGSAVELPNHTEMPLAEEQQPFVNGGSTYELTKEDTYVTARPSEILGKNLVAANGPQPVNTAAHHIVASGNPRAATSRAILAAVGININDAINGYFCRKIRIRLTQLVLRCIVRSIQETIIKKWKVDC
jgi:RHS repeat-associated protein